MPLVLVAGAGGLGCFSMDFRRAEIHAPRTGGGDTAASVDGGAAGEFAGGCFWTMVFPLRPGRGRKQADDVG
jgi:hypothetical protein